MDFRGAEAATRTKDARRDAGPRSGTPTLLACAVAGFVLVVAVGLQAPARSVGLRWKWTLRSRRLPPISIEPFDRGVIEIAGSGGLDPWRFSPLAWILAALVAFGILIWITRGIRRNPRSSPAINLTGMGPDGGVPREANAQIVHSGLAAALQTLTLERDPGNAVVRAWQGLQDAAADAGLNRRPAETTSEFTARILYRSRNSAEPIDMLLSLYQRVRFGNHHPDAGEIASARDSLSALVKLWQTDLPDRHPTKGLR